MFTRLQLVILYDISTNNFLFKKYQLKYFFLTNQHIFPSKSVIVYVENAFLSVLFNVSIDSAHGSNFKPCYLVAIQRQDYETDALILKS